MKLSELIEKLSSIHSSNGDLEVSLVSTDSSLPNCIDEIDVSLDEEYVEIYFS